MVSSHAWMDASILLFVAYKCHLRFKILSCAYSFSAFDLYELNVINLIILFCFVFVVLSKCVDADP